MSTYPATQAATGLQKASMGYARNRRVWAVVTTSTFEKVKKLALDKDTTISNITRLAVEDYLRRWR